MSYLIDTDIVSAHLKYAGKLTSRFLQYSGRLHLSVLTLGELMSWTLRKNSAPKYQEELVYFLADVQLLDVTPEIAQIFGSLRAQLMDQGIVVSSIDMLIAATALYHDFTLVTHNVRHFEKIPGLNIVDWLDK
jgi:predicted nucleic acid-binding protein